MAVCSGCGVEEGQWHAIWVQNESPSGKAAKAFTLTGIGGNEVGGICLYEPMEVPYSEDGNGISYRNFMAYLWNNFEIGIPDGARILHGAQTVEWCDMVRADESSDVATLTLVLGPCGVEDGIAGGAERLLDYDRPHALNPLPGMPHATISTLREEHVHRCPRRGRCVLVCPACYSAISEMRSSRVDWA